MRKLFLIAIALLLLSLNVYCIDGKVIQTSLISKNTGKVIPFSIYLPPNYDNESEKYPVIFHLHGIGGAHNGNQISEVPKNYEIAFQNGKIEKIIIIFPDGFKDAFWSDSKNSDKPAESNLINELLPYVKSQYRVKENCFAIQGFSMGGFGASKIFSKYPDLFCSLISYDGAFLNIDGMIKFHNSLWKEIFNEDSIYFKENSPWEFFKSDADILKKKSIRILKGSLGYNVDFNTYISNLGFKHDYVETSCDHVLKCLLDNEGEKSWIMHQAGLAMCDNTSISDNYSVIDYNIYPNPAKTTLFIQGQTDYISKYEILNTFGQTMQSGMVGDGRINVSFLENGIYLLKLNNSIRKFMLVR